MADAPPFDPSKPFETVGGGASTAPPFDPSKPFDSVPQVGTAEAVGRGAASGLTMGWYDELRGLAEAGGATPEKPMTLGQVMLGGYRRAVGDEAAGQHYDAAVARERGRMQQAQAEHPYAYGAGELGGMVGGMAAMPVEAGAGLWGRAAQGAKLGAITGALSGAGEAEGGVRSRLAGAGLGAGEGLVGGALSAPVASAIEGAGRLAYDALGRPIVSAVRGAINPEREAARRAVGAIERDIATGRAGLDPRDWQAAQAAGEPVSVMDLGGETTRALARSAANTSPEARAALSEMAQERFYGQNERASDLIRSLVATPANADATRDALEASARKANKPLYDQAFADGQDIPFHAGFQQLLEAPAVRDAVRQATVTGANKAAAMGVKPVRNPFTFDEQGLPSLTDPNVRPSLQFWDAVKQNLDDRIGSLQRSGEKAAARDAITLKGQLVDYLDQTVPSYARARGTAASFFGANDALEAGQKAVNFGGDPAVVAKQMAKMNSAERDLFREGYASKWADNVFRLGDSRDATKAMYQSPQARELAHTVLGPQAADRLEAFIHRERIMNFARNAITGNSSTARQLIEAGLAGGAIGGLLEGRDPYSLAHGIGTGATLALGARAGAGRLIGYVDQNVARRVGELLASDDISQLGQGLRMAARHGNILARLRDLDTRIASSAAVRGAPALQAGALGYGQGNQQNVPGPPSQHKDGGGVGEQGGVAHGGGTVARRDGGAIPHISSFNDVPLEPNRASGDRVPTRKERVAAILKRHGVKAA